MRFAHAAALRGVYDEQLSKGRAFVAGASAASEREACELVLEHGGRTLSLSAEVVFRKEDGPGRGVGLQLAPLDAARKGALCAFVDEADRAADASKAAPEEAPEDDVESSDDGDADGERAPKTVFDRIRGLTTAEQQRVAANGTMQERIVLERTFGANVWESLLGNPRLTVPEVARIARKGTLPRKLVEDIAAHASWVAAPEVQRALLANPRSTAAVIAKVLRALPRGELQLVPQQTAYPASVRAAAKKLLGGG
jgi:hypothetical protein